MCIVSKIINESQFTQFLFCSFFWVKVPSLCYFLKKLETLPGLMTTSWKLIFFPRELNPMRSLKKGLHSSIHPFCGLFSDLLWWSNHPLFRYQEHHPCQKSYHSDIVWYVLVTNLPWQKWVPIDQVLQSTFFSR